jgi:hypothetical protein
MNGVCDHCAFVCTAFAATVPSTLFFLSTFCPNVGEFASLGEKSATNSNMKEEFNYTSHLFPLSTLTLKTLILSQNWAFCPVH